MPRKAKTGTKTGAKKTKAKKRNPQHGAGFFNDLGNSLLKVGRFIKDKKLISKGLTLAGNVTGHQGLKTAGNVAQSIGLGKPKRGKGLRLAGQTGPIKNTTKQTGKGRLRKQIVFP